MTIAQVAEIFVMAFLLSRFLTKYGMRKTLAFGVPMLARISDAAEPSMPLGLVLVPTRELAVQVAEVLEPLASHAGMKVLPVYGGASRHHQIDELAKGVEIVFIISPPSEDNFLALSALRREPTLPRVFMYDPAKYPLLYYDRGLRFDHKHLNLVGAEKLTNLLARQFARHVQRRGG